MEQDDDDTNARAYEDEMNHQEDNDEDQDAYAEDEDDEDEELAAMFAKVQSIQQAQGFIPPAKPTPAPAPAPDNKTKNQEPSASSSPVRPAALDVTAINNEKNSKSTTKHDKKTPRTPASASSSPANSLGRLSAVVSVSEDGIKTISRRALLQNSGANATMDALLGIRKPAIYDDRVLQTAKESAETFEKLKQQTVAAPPPTIAKRVESLAQPKKKQPHRQFALDDDAKHCRFQPKKTAAQKAAMRNTACGYDFDNHGGGDDSGNRHDFISRMEAAEKNRQKKLEMTRGEKEYDAKLNKKCCPKCGLPQSYSEFRDKKKRCQNCGVEFRIPQAWGDIGSEFMARMSDAAKQQTENKLRIRDQVVQEETFSQRKKTPKQQFYEKQMIQKQTQASFLDRNYQATNKQKQAQLQIQNAISQKGKQSPAAML